MQARALLLFLGLGTLTGPALAQRRRPPPPQPAPAAAPESPRPTGTEVPPEYTRTDPSGLTAAHVGARAGSTSFVAKAQEEALKAAAYRVDQAWTTFLPKLTATGRYTRVSNFTAPSLLIAPPGVSQVLTVEPPSRTPGLDPAQMVGAPFPDVSFAPVLDNYLLQATIGVPITDYFLRIGPAYNAATNVRDAVSHDALAAHAKAGADGKIAFYTWLRARGAAVVAIQALHDQRTHLRDATNQFDAGSASKADVLRGETAAAAAELQVARAKNLVTLAEKQVRIALHAGDGGDEALVPAESLDAAPPPVEGSLAALTQEAMSARQELKSLTLNAAALREQASVARASMFPTISAFADAVSANPNARKLPLTAEWFPTWDVGAQVTWSPNDAVIGAQGGGDADSRAAALEAQRDALRDAIELEVMQAHQAVQEADVGLEVTKRELTSAQEAYRVGRELFLTGRGTSATLTDAETELTRARLDALNAKVDSRVARVRLEHAIGRDVKQAPAP